MGETVKKILERVVGIEPASSAWKAAALPLCYTRTALVYVMTNVNGGGRRTRTFEAYAADLQSAPFATRDIPPFTRPPERGLIKTPTLKSIVKKQ